MWACAGSRAEFAGRVHAPGQERAGRAADGDEGDRHARQEGHQHDSDRQHRLQHQRVVDREMRIEPRGLEALGGEVAAVDEPDDAQHAAQPDRGAGAWL